MIEVNRSIVVAHRMLRPIAAARQVTTERLHMIKIDALADPENQDLQAWMRAVAAGAIKPLATSCYPLALKMASKVANRNVIGAGIETLVAKDGIGGSSHEVSKYATDVNGIPGRWTSELAHRQEKAKKVMGKFLIDTEYSVGNRTSRHSPPIVVMHQPFIDIKDHDGHKAADMSEQRGEFRELAEKLAHDDGYYFDVIPGHGNLVVHEVEGQRQLAVADAVIMSVEDTVRPFVPFAPNPKEWAGWLATVHS